MDDKLLYIIAAASFIVLILLLNWYIKWKAYGKEEAEAARLNDLCGCVVRERFSTGPQSLI